MPPREKPPQEMPTGEIPQPASGQPDPRPAPLRAAAVRVLVRCLGWSLVWAIVAALVVVPLAVAAASPLLAWRQPVYVVAGFSGVVALALVFLQPLFAARLLPGLKLVHARWLHRLAGALLVAAVAVHVAGLWVTSPPDVIDALLLASPTPFSVWGVAAMWALVAALALALLRRRLGLAPRSWRRLHAAAAAVVVVGALVHALLIEGTMGPLSKAALCAAALAAFLAGIVRLDSFSLMGRLKGRLRGLLKGRLSPRSLPHRR